MGKKRRYLNRVKKFGNKMFRWLDSCDGTRDDQLLDSRIDTVISSLSIVDRGNQTFNFVATCTGPGGGANNLAGDRVYYLVDGTAVHSTQVPTMTDNGAGKKRKRWTCTGADPATFGGATDVLLTPGEHTLTAVIQTSVAGNAEISEAVTKKFTIARSEIKVDTSDADFLEEGGTDGNVKVNIDKLAVSGKQPGVEADYSPTQTAAAGRHGYRLSVKDSAGTTVKVGGGAGADHLDTTDGSGLDSHNDLLLAGYVAGLDAGDYTYTVTFVPLGADDAPLTDDAVSKAITITKG